MTAESVANGPILGRSNGRLRGRAEAVFTECRDGLHGCAFRCRGDGVQLFGAILIQHNEVPLCFAVYVYQ